MASLNFTSPLGLTSNNPFRETMEAASDPLKSTIQAAQLYRYNKGTASATDVLAVLKQKRKDERAKMGIKAVDTKQKVDALPQQRRELAANIKDMLSTKDYAGQEKQVKQSAAKLGVSSDKVDEFVAKNTGAPTQQQKIEQIRKNVGNMKQSRYESQKAAQQKRYDQRFAEMDRQKKLKENILKARQNRTANAQKSKTKAPAGTTDSTGPALYGYKGTNNPDKV